MFPRAGVPRRQLQALGARQRAAPRQRTGVTEETDHLGGAQPARADEPGARRGVLLQAVVARVASVGQHPVRAAPWVERQLRGGRVEQGAAALLLPLRAPADADRDLPEAGTVPGGAGGQPPVLRELHHRSAAPASQRRLHPGDARTVEKGVERRGDVPAGAVRDGPEEVGGGGIAIRMRAQVLLDSPAERLLAHPLLEHAEHRGALVVGDGVERVPHVVVGADGLPDDAGGHQRVRLRRQLSHLHPLGSHPPRREPTAR